MITMDVLVIEPDGSQRIEKREVPDDYLPLEPEPEPLEPPVTDYVTFADLAEMLGLAAEPDSRKAIAETLSDVALVSRERKVELELEPGIIDKPIKGLST